MGICWWLAALLSLLAGVGALYGGATATLAAAFMRRPAGASGLSPAVTVLKPLHGDEPGLYDNLLSFCRQDYSGPVQVVFAVAAASDAALAIVGRVKQAGVHASVSLVVNPRQHGANRKISNLINAMEAAEHDVIVLADSDMRVEPTYLRTVVGALHAPGVGAVSCLYRGHAARGFLSRLGALGIDTQFLPNALLGVATGLAKPCFGSTIALRRETLDAVGGFRAFRDVLADDYALGAAVRARGLAVAFPPLVLDHLCADERTGTLWRHELRWGRTIRTVDPLGYAGSVVTHPVPLAILAAALSGLAPWSLAVLALALVARAVSLAHLRATLGLARASMPLLALRDFFSFAVFLGSWAGRGVHWQDAGFRVRADGTLTETPSGGPTKESRATPQAATVPRRTRHTRG